MIAILRLVWMRALDWLVRWCNHYSAALANLSRINVDTRQTTCLRLPRPPGASSHDAREDPRRGAITVRGARLRGHHDRRDRKAGRCLAGHRLPCVRDQ